MARLFDGSDDLIDYGSGFADYSAGPWTFATLIKPDAADAAIKMVLDAQKAAVGSGAFLSTHSGGTGRIWCAQTTDSDWYASVSANNSYSTGVWQVWVGTWAGEGDNNFPKIYIDSPTEHASYALQSDGSNGVDTPNDTDGVWYVGGRGSGTPAFHFDADIAYTAFWAAELGVGEIKSLINRDDPRLVRPQSLVFAPPMIRGFADPISGAAGTATGTTVVPHPRLILPHSPRMIHVPAVVAAAGLPQRHYPRGVETGVMRGVL